MIPPHDLDIEAALLGAMLLGPQLSVGVFDVVSAADFYSPAHASVFSVFEHLHRNGRTVEINDATTELRSRGDLETVGGRAKLIDLWESCGAPSAATEYAHQVADHAKRRRIIAAAEQIAHHGYTHDSATAFEKSFAALDAVERTSRSSLRVMSRDELDLIPPPEWLVEGITTTGFTVLYGPSGTGKSFLALDWACSVATGTKWFNRATSRRTVMYVAAEGTSGIPRRVAAWELDRRHRATDLLLVPQVVNLLAAAEVASLGTEVKSRKVGLLVVDTLARSMPGGDENASQDMGRLIHALTEIQNRSGCAVVLVHHSGVEKSRMRGSTSLYGAADTVVKCEGENGLVFVTCEKQKDDDAFQPWHLRQKVVQDSVVLSLAGNAQADDALARLRSELSEGRALPYIDVIRLAGGDGQVVLSLVEKGKLVKLEDDPKLYTLAVPA